MDLRASLTGLVVGFFVGLTGMGAGSLMTPLLILLLHYKTQYAIGSDLAYSTVMKGLGAWQHRKTGNVNIALSWQLALGSVPASLMGVWWSHQLEVRLGDAGEHLLLRLLGVMLIVVALALLARMLPITQRMIPALCRPSSRHHWVWAIGLGAGIGFLVGLTSVGGGTLFGVVLLAVFGLSSRQMIGTDLYHAAILSGAAALGQALVGNVCWPLVGSLLIGAGPGVLLGGRLSQQLPEAVLRPTLALVLLLSGLKMF